MYVFQNQISEKLKIDMQKVCFLKYDFAFLEKL